MIRFQQSQALTSHFESFWSIVFYVKLISRKIAKMCYFFVGYQKVHSTCQKDWICGRARFYHGYLFG